jgi:uncharacterized membrane protein
VTEATAPSQRARRLPGEEPACLQIAVGILGTLLLIIASLLSRWRWSSGTSVGVVALLAGLLLVGAGGFGGLRERRQSRAASLMVAGNLLLTFSALAFLIVSFGGAFSWAFPLGSIFTTLALFSDLATYRFRRAVSRASSLRTPVPES